MPITSNANDSHAPPPPRQRRLWNLSVHRILSRGFCAIVCGCFIRFAYQQPAAGGDILSEVQYSLITDTHTCSLTHTHTGKVNLNHLSSCSEREFEHVCVSASGCVSADNNNTYRVEIDNIINIIILLTATKWYRYFASQRKI